MIKNLKKCKVIACIIAITISFGCAVLASTDTVSAASTKTYTKMKYVYCSLKSGIHPPLALKIKIVEKNGKISSKSVTAINAIKGGDHTKISANYKKGTFSVSGSAIIEGTPIGYKGGTHEGLCNVAVKDIKDKKYK